MRFRSLAKQTRMNNAYLFVYGTLRKGYGLKLLQEIGSALTYVGEATVQATLFDLGDFPGAVKGGEAEIKGDVFTLHDWQVFDLLDAYEGEAFKREEAKVRLQSGEKVKAWLYWYTGNTANCPAIPNGDYLDYLKSKKDRFV